MSQELDNLLRTIQAQVDKKWRLLGEQLGMSSDDLDYIQSMVVARPAAAENGFQLILKKSSICCPLTYHTWRDLITALDKMGEDTDYVTHYLEYVRIATKITVLD